MLHRLLGRPRRRPLSRTTGYRPRLEALEDRTVLSTTATSIFLVAAPTAYAGQPTQVTAIPLDATNHMVPSFTGTVALTSAGAGDTLPAAHTFQAGDHGFYTFTLTPAAVGGDKVTATDSADAISGSVMLNVVAAPVATQFFLLPLNNAVAGAPEQVAVIALDASNHTVPGYAGTVTLTSSVAGDTLPAPYQFQASDHGIHVFTLTPVAPGNDTITARDASGDTGQVTINVSPGQVATQFYLVGPRTAYTGQPTQVTVFALDATGHLVRNYGGTVTLTSTGTGDTLPAAYQFQAGDHGIHVFTLTPGSPGSDVVTATDGGGVKGQVTLDVIAAPVATHFFVTALPGSWDDPAGVTVGTATRVAVIALDASNHIVPGYGGTVTLTSTLAGDTIAPASHQFQASDHGIYVFTLTPGSTGSDTVTATDTNGVTGQVVLGVTPAPVATHFFLIAPHNVPVGTAVPVTVVALDANNHIVTNFTGTVTLTSSDMGATLPGPTPFQAGDRGIHRFMVTFATAGSQTVVATDSADHLSGTVTVPVGQGGNPWWWI